MRDIVECRTSWNDETAENYAVQQHIKGRLKDVSGFLAPFWREGTPRQMCCYCLTNLETQAKCKAHMKTCVKMPFKMWVARARMAQTQLLEGVDKSTLSKCRWCGTTSGDLRSSRHHEHGCGKRMRANKIKVIERDWFPTVFEDAELPERFLPLFQAN